MATSTPAHVPLIPLRSVEYGTANAPPRWCVRLVFVGANPDNASGESEKYWQITGTAGTGTAEVRWGRLGSRGQSQTVALAKAIETARKKIRKGYSEDVDTTAVARAVADRERAVRSAPVAPPKSAPAPSNRPASLAAALVLVRWRALGADAFVDAVASLGLSPVDVDGLPVRLFAGRKGRWWAVREDASEYGEVPAWGAL